MTTYRCTCGVIRSNKDGLHNCTPAVVLLPSNATQVLYDEVNRLSTLLAHSEARVVEQGKECERLRALNSEWAEIASDAMRARDAAIRQREEAEGRAVRAERSYAEAERMSSNAVDESVRRILATRKLCEAIGRFRRYGTDNAEADIYKEYELLRDGTVETAASIADTAQRDTAEQIAAWCYRMGWDHTADLIKDGSWKQEQGGKSDE